MRLRLPAPTNKKIGSGSGAALKVAAPGGSGSATLIQKEITFLFTVSALSYFAGSVTIIPDPDLGKSSGSMQIRIQNSKKNHTHWLR